MNTKPGQLDVKFKLPGLRMVRHSVASSNKCVTSTDCLKRSTYLLASVVLQMDTIRAGNSAVLVLGTGPGFGIAGAVTVAYLMYKFGWTYMQVSPILFMAYCDVVVY